MHNLLAAKKYLYAQVQPLSNRLWNSLLHPRNSIGEFIYTDGGKHEKSASAVYNKTGINNINDAAINKEMLKIYSLILDGPKSLTGLEFYNFMLRLDTIFHGLTNYRFKYVGTAYAELKNTTMTGHELNYIGIGAGYAAYGFSLAAAESLTNAYDKRRHGQSATRNIYKAVAAGYNAMKHFAQ